MKHLIFIFIFIFFSINYSFGNLKERQIPLSGNPVILFVAKNNVSNILSVHTYKLNSSISNEETSDINGHPDYPNNVQLIIDSFLSVQGVSRCTFDKATHSFTILTSPSVELLQIVEMINN